MSDANDWFSTTQWSVVLAAGDSRASEGAEALARLCRTYWPPAYAFARSRGHDVETAQDLVQGFFTQLLDKRYLKRARQERGKFRAFLLVSMKHYMANEWDRTRAQKRGGDRQILPLEFDGAESTYRIDPADPQTPESLFDRRWALTVLERALQRIETEIRETGNEERFRCFRPYLTASEDGPAYRELAERLSMSESAVKVAVHRLRRRYGKLIRDEVAQTVETPDEIDGEIRHLFAALGS